MKRWIEVLVYIAVGTAAVAHCVNILRGKNGEREITPQPLVVKEHSGTASQGDIDQIHGRIKRERLEMEQKLAELKAEYKDLSEKIDRDIADLHERINDVPERTIKLLRETKGLI